MSILHIAFYPSDWLAGTRGMSDAETGVYITLIAKMYEMAGPIERDDQRLARLCGCKTKNSFVKALDYLISEGKISDTKNGLFNDRVQKEIKNTTEKSSKAKAAAEARWDKKPNKNNDSTNANALSEHIPQECQLEPELDIREDTDVSSSTKPKKRKSRIPENAVISDAQFQAATKRGHSLQEAEAQFEKFKNDALAKGKLFVDWDRAYVNWLDSEFFRPLVDGVEENGQSNRNQRNSDPNAGSRQVTFAAGFTRTPDPDW